MQVPGLGGGAGAAGTASFAVYVPAAKAGTPTMQSAVITVAMVNGMPPAVAVPPIRVNLTSKTPGCKTASSGSMNCVLSMAVPAGNDVFSIATFSQPNGIGTALSQAQTSAVITPGGKTLCVQQGSPAAAGSSPSPTAVKGATQTQGVR